MEKNINILLIDADDTLLDFEKNELNALNRTIEYARYPDGESFIQTYMEINNRVWKDLEQGKIESDAINPTRFALLHRELSKEIALACSPEELGEYYLDQLCQGGYLLEGAREILEYLSGKYTLVLATNGLARVQRARVRKAGIEQFFERHAISQELGYHKPDPRFFELALEGFDYSKEQVIMIGDSLFSDMAGADAFGIKSIWYNPREILNDRVASPDYEVSHLKEIKEIL